MRGPNAEPQVEELTPQQKIEWCLYALGQRMTTVGLGLTDAGVVREMSIGEEILPDAINERTDLLYGAAKRVADVYDNATARSFLRSSNPYAGDRSILEFTAICGTEEDSSAAHEVVDGAVEAFLA